MLEPCASGAGMIDMRRAIEEMVGAAAVTQALATVDDDVRREYDGMSPLTWVRLSTAHTVHAAIARQVGRDVEEFHDAAVRAAVARSFKTIWRVFLTFTSDDALVKRTAAMYRKARNVGEMTSSISQPGRAVAVLSGWPGMGERHMRSIAIGQETVLTLAGRRGVRTTWQKTDDGAVFTSTWA